MNLGFDAIRVFYNRTGLGNYSRYVLRVLTAAYPEHRYVLYTPGLGGHDAPAWTAPAGADIDVALPPPPLAGGPLSKTVWRTWALGKRAAADGIEVFHGLSHELPRDMPRAGLRGVVTMHDLIYLRRPQDFTAIDRKLYDWKFRRSCQAADAVVAVSRATADDLVRHYDLPAAKIHVVAQGCEPRFHHTAPAAERAVVRQRWGIDDDYVLAVGTIEPRKNAALAVQALAALPAAHRPQLVLVGRATAYARQVAALAAELGVEDRLCMRHEVPDADLPALYQGARAFLYLSRLEGFGIPVLEAMASGLPVVAAATSSLPEVGGEAALYVDPDDPAAVAAALAALLHDGAAAAERAAAGRARAAAFADEHIAAQLMDVYAQVLGADG